MRIRRTCGNTKLNSNKMKDLEVRLIKFSPDSETGRMRITCKVCGNQTQES